MTKADEKRYEKYDDTILYSITERGQDVLDKILVYLEQPNDTKYNGKSHKKGTVIEEIFNEIGYDLRPIAKDMDVLFFCSDYFTLRDLMKNSDLSGLGGKTRWINFAFRRLIKQGLVDRIENLTATEQINIQSVP